MKFLLTTLLLITAFCTNFYSQTTWFVSNIAPGTQNGTSWNNAFHNLQLAMNTAKAGDSIFVATGVYKPTEIAGGSADPRDKTFLLKNGVHVYGGFIGNESGLSDRINTQQHLFVNFKTELNGDIGIAGDSSDNAYHVVTGIDLTSPTTLNGFVITKGNANDSSSLAINGTSMERNFGGGISISNSNLMIESCLIHTNLVKSGGGGINIKNSNNVVITDCVIESNRIWGNDPNSFGGGGLRNLNSDGNYINVQFRKNQIDNAQGGGGIRNEGSSPVLDFVTFIENKAFNGDGGAGMYNAMNSNPIIKNSYFTLNYTADQGGGIYNDNSKPTIEKVVFSTNTADNGGGAMENDGGSDVTLTEVNFYDNVGGVDGGAIQNWKSSPIIDKCDFFNNHADRDGGGMFNYNDCSPVISNSWFDGNTADRNGGGIYNRRNCNPVLTNLLITRNHAKTLGGGAYSASSNGSPCSPISTNLTIANNSADSSGGGSFDDGAGDPKLRNSIIYGNTSPGTDDIDAPASLALTALFYSIIGNEFYVDGLTTPTTFTGLLFEDSTTQDYTLRNGSAAIDVGDSNYFNSGKTPDLSSIDKDLREADRIMGGNIDLGAYESCASTGPPTINITVNPGNTIEIGTTVTFTATYTRGGFDPHFNWLKNNIPILSAPDTNVIELVAGVDFDSDDSITVFLTSNEICATTKSVQSNAIGMTIVVGIDENGKGNLFSFYPNPTSNHLTVAGKFMENEDYSFNILDLTGKKIFEGTSKNENNKLNINLPSKINNGTYLIRIIGNDNLYIHSRIIINR